jgi:hypothetical protein
MARKNQPEREAKILVKAWKDPVFKKKLLSNPKAILSEMGYEFPGNINVRLHEDNANTYTLVLHTPPAHAQKLSESELEKIAAAAMGLNFDQPKPRDTLMTKPNIKALEAKVLAKAWKDPAFRKELVNYPRETLTKMGFEIPKNVNVHIHEDNSNTFTFVLRAPPANFQKLSENELEKVAAAVPGIEENFLAKKNLKIEE